jgi:hypothetical protein
MNIGQLCKPGDLPTERRVKNYITLTFLNIIQNVHGSVPEKEIIFEARRGFNHDSTSKTVQHRLVCPVLSIRTGVINSFFHLKQIQV